MIPPVPAVAYQLGPHGITVIVPAAPKPLSTCERLGGCLGTTCCDYCGEPIPTVGAA